MKRTAIALVLAAAAAVAQAGTVSVAVASNFTATMKELAPAFERQSGHRLEVSYGGTGSFYAQIKNGARYDVLLSADAKTPARLEREGLAVIGSATPYAFGRLVLWSADPKLVDSKGKVLTSGSWKKCAIADPKLAPYGEAAIETLEEMKLKDRVLAKAVTGTNVGQAFQFAASGNAEIGFVSYSQILKDGKPTGSFWVVPKDSYRVIRQDAVLLTHGKDSAAAAEFMEFLGSRKASAIIRAHGYSMAQP